MKNKTGLCRWLPWALCLGGGVCVCLMFFAVCVACPICVGPNGKVNKPYFADKDSGNVIINDAQGE